MLIDIDRDCSADSLNMNGPGSESIAGMHGSKIRVLWVKNLLLDPGPLMTQFASSTKSCDAHYSVLRCMMYRRRNDTDAKDEHKDGLDILLTTIVASPKP